MVVTCPNCHNACRLGSPVPAGTLIRCPSCAMGFACPPARPVVAAAPIVPAAPPPPLPAATPARPCPFCGEEIKAEARKCRWCGEVLDPVLRATQESARAAGRDEDKAVAMIFSFFLPGGGQMYRGETGRGIAFLLGTLLGIFPFVIPAVVVYIWSIADAARPRNREE